MRFLGCAWVALGGVSLGLFGCGSDQSGAGGAASGSGPGGGASTGGASAGTGGASAGASVGGASASGPGGAASAGAGLGGESNSGGASGAGMGGAERGGGANAGAGGSTNAGAGGSTNAGAGGVGSSGGGVGGSAGSGGSGGAIAPTTCPMPTGTAVTLTQNGNNYSLSNGLVNLSFNASGNLTQVVKNGKNLMGAGDTLYVSEGGGTAYHAINASVRTVVQQTADIVELSFVDQQSADMNWDLHYVLRRGVSGFYYFLIADTVGRAAVTLSELRTVQRFDQGTLSNGYNGERHGALPTAAQNATFTTANQIQDTTWPLPGGAINPGTPYSEGPVYSKYDWASYRIEDQMHGLYGSGYGAWLISSSFEYYTGGPVKQELMVHQSNLVLNMYHGGHFGAALTAASPANWQKMYGPNLVYVNAGTDASVIADAQQQAQADRAQWPYCWMKNALYPLSEQRGTVTGTVVEAHGQSVANAMVVLAQPGPLLTQGYEYMFWTHADAAGNFAIGNVRPGSYALHVYPTQGTIIVDATHGEVAKTGINVVAGANALGTVTWSPAYHAKLLWSIGSSDQTSGEFRYDPGVPVGDGNIANNTGRNYGPDATHGVWTVPPAATTYTIGTSTPSSDWYFAQGVSGTWTVKFNLASVPPGGAFLTIGIAGAARNPKLAVAANGHALLSQTFGNDGSIYRSAIKGGSYEVLTATVPAQDLLAGANTFTFTLANGTGGTAVLYDALKLESD
jgi:rhamnogalacturonan endolyase